MKETKKKNEDDGGLVGVLTGLSNNDRAARFLVYASLGIILLTLLWVMK